MIYGFFYASQNNIWQNFLCYFNACTVVGLADIFTANPDVSTISFLMSPLSSIINVFAIRSVGVNVVPLLYRF
ncbi:hypothetical protein SAMN04487935_1689 [Flavobacterium noncentrifugens]|uniref:Uncharacterized protein n=1 Tax=Flavobacterium noncentrifugens TaxID=1128970 RepID=A0A1G8W7K3_9FLAO|nr:hypothetical protein SAMN04487935_1689 [Flavobacterium noncentrifugens]